MNRYSDWKPSISECEDTLRNLVQINTCQPEGNEEELVDFIIRTLPQGVEYQKIVHGLNRASLIVKVKGESEEGGLAFLGHVDTVACPNEQEWKYPPHKAQMEGSCLFGRGSADMKGGVTAMILALRQLCQEKLPWKEPLYFCFTADEENKGMGACAVVKSQLLNTVRQMIICEPSDEKIGLCEKGALWIRAYIKGVSAHGARPTQGANAIDAAIKLAGELKKEFENKGSHEILGRNTVSVTKLNGGNMTNMIPCEAVMEMDIRTIPKQTHEEIIEKAQEISSQIMKDKSGIQIKLEVINNRPALETSREHPFVQKLYEIAEQVGISTEKKGHYFYTDASQVVPHIPVPFVIAGPGNDAIAHCIDECIDLNSVMRFTELYYRYSKKHYLKEEKNE